jgi:hypothetical protein
LDATRQELLTPKNISPPKAYREMENKMPTSVRKVEVYEIPATADPIEPEAYNPVNNPRVIDNGQSRRPIARTRATHNVNAPLLEPLDGLALVLAIVITLGPLAAYAVGWGL